jgi:outer membrane protein OmpA-like peptidoglycan-associated protein
MIRPILMCAVRRVCLALLLSFLGVGTRAHAQTGGGTPAPPHLDRSFDVQLFHPAVGAQSFITLDSAEVLEHRMWHFGMVAGYARQPLTYTLRGIGESASSTTLAPVQNLAMAELVAAVGIRNRFEVGAALPLALTWGGDGFDRYGLGTGGKAVAAAFGDLRVEGKAEVVGFGRDRAFLLSLSASGTLPIGDDSAFLGEKNLTARARALLEYQRGDRLRAVVMAGGLLRETSQFLGTPEGMALLYGAAVEVRPTQEMGVFGEVIGRYASKYSDTNPAEFDAAMRFYLPGRVNLLMGAGFGLNQGIGSPVVRAFLGVGWAPDYRDRDHDGIIDRLDKCPDEPEDWDGFQDSDGCPDPDNDGDGIPDKVDKCPNEPEDFDTFQDDDGCPDQDNDADGIADLYDACPNQREDGLGGRPKDGCPSTTEDRDGDGLHDAIDMCPDEPEDRDGFADEDGCPDHDNDGDGVPDPYDLCPNEPEDPDGFEDDDGCPELDNDHDGIPDAEDKCPNQPETINFYKDEDGCPDPGPELVRLGESDDKVYLSENINFHTGAGGKPQLTMNGNLMLALVARVLKGHIEISMVRIEVHGKDASREVTQERGEVVRAALVKNGYDAGRLKVVGLGAGPNRVDLIIESREKPRRNLRPVPAPAPAAGAGDATSGAATESPAPGAESPEPPENPTPPPPTAHPHEEAP